VAAGGVLVLVWAEQKESSGDAALAQVLEAAASGGTVCVCAAAAGILHARCWPVCAPAGGSGKPHHLRFLARVRVSRFLDLGFEWVSFFSIQDRFMFWFFDS